MDSTRVFAEYPRSGGEESLSVLADRLLQAQAAVWPDLGLGLEALSSVQVRTIVGERYSTLVQYNPQRMTSTGAKVDPKSIARRKCFLCRENLPPPQQGILYRDEYLILCNPAPIFRGHFTIAHIDHRPQAIASAMDTFFALARDLSPSHQLFYNGPRCGASAPDHLHFQASPAGSIPLADQRFLDAHANGRSSVGGVEVLLLRDTDRSVLTFGASTREQAAFVLEKILVRSADILKTSEEPLVNIVAWWAREAWQVAVILRMKHRPEAYFREGRDRLVISPAAVDMGGLVITPRHEDFQRLDEQTVSGIYREVSLEPQSAASILETLA